jgi:hypothetical protein
VPFDHLGVPHQCLELGDGQLVELLLFLLGQLWHCVLIFTGDFVVLIIEDLALVSAVGFPRDLPTVVQAHAELFEHALVGGEGRVILSKKGVIYGAVGIDLIGRVGILLNLEVGEFARAIGWCLLPLDLVLVVGIGYLGAVLLRQLARTIHPKIRGNSRKRGAKKRRRRTSAWAFFCSFFLARRIWFLVIFGAAIVACCEPMAQE